MLLKRSCFLVDFLSIIGTKLAILIYLGLFAAITQYV